MRLKAIAAALRIVALTAAGTVGAAQTALRVIGRKSASGDFAIALASGRTNKPTALYLRALGVPIRA